MIDTLAMLWDDCLAVAGTDKAKSYQFSRKTPTPLYRTQPRPIDRGFLLPTVQEIPHSVASATLANRPNRGGKAGREQKSWHCLPFASSDLDTKESHQDSPGILSTIHRADEARGKSRFGEKERSGLRRSGLVDTSAGEY